MGTRLPSLGYDRLFITAKIREMQATYCALPFDVLKFLQQVHVVLLDPLIALYRKLSSMVINAPT